MCQYRFVAEMIKRIPQDTLLPETEALIIKFPSFTTLKIGRGREIRFFSVLYDIIHEEDGIIMPMDSFKNKLMMISNSLKIDSPLVKVKILTLLPICHASKHLCHLVAAGEIWRKVKETDS